MFSSLLHGIHVIKQRCIPRRRTATDPSEIKIKKIPAIDVSWEAHVVLLSAILCQAFIQGIPFCFGIFENHYEHNKIPGYQRASWIGVCAIGMMDVGSPLITYLCNDRKMNPRTFIIASWAISILSMVTASFCKTINTLGLTQGFLLGLSVMFMEMPGLIILNTWFVKRRGLVYGLLFSCTDIFGAGFSYIARGTLDSLGLRYTFLIFAALTFVIPGIAIWSFRPRPSSPSDTTIQYASIARDSSEDHNKTPLPETVDQLGVPAPRLFYVRPLFYVFLVMTCFQSFAFYIPSIYLPTYNTQILASILDCATQNTNLLAVFNLSMIPGQLMFGWLSDRMNVHLLAGISSSVAALATFLLWGGLVGDVSASFASLMTFAGLFGGFGSGYLPLWGRMCMSFDNQAQAERVYSYFSLVRALGTFASGPVSSATLQWGTQLGLNKPGTVGINTKYRILILFVGCCMTIAALSSVAGYFTEVLENRGKRDTAGEGRDLECAEKETSRSAQTGEQMSTGQDELRY